MPVTIVGPTRAYPLRAISTYVEVKRRWEDSWQIDPELIPVMVSAAVSGHDMERCELRRVYGEAKLPHEADLGVKHQDAGFQFENAWIRVMMTSGGAKIPLFLGQIAGDARDVMDSTAHGDTGLQNYVAYGPTQILRKIHVSRAKWDEGGTLVTTGWLPGMNDASRGRGYDRGNRSQGQILAAQTFVYSGEFIDALKRRAEWTNYDYLRYLLTTWVQTADGPAWYVDGEVGYLQQLSESADFRGTMTADQILRELIPLKYGLNWTFEPHSAGFTLRVFSLSARTWSFGPSAALPANPNRVTLALQNTQEQVRARLVYSADHTYKTIRVIGKRIVVCCSLRDYWDRFSAGTLPSNTLVKGWTEADESAYRAGTGKISSAEEHDRARAAERYRDVFQRWVAPADWDHQAGQAAPIISDNAVVQPGTATDYQNAQRTTLSWLPLRAGWDYTLTTPQPPPGSTGGEELMPPAAWLASYKPDWSILERDRHYTLAETLGIHVSALRDNLGILLQAAPNHLTAKSAWATAANAGTKKQPQYDAREMVVTLAFEADQRLMLVYENPAANAHGVLDVEVQDAELWYLAPNTVVGTDAAGKLQQSPATPVLVRNDADRLRFVMAGILSRYAASRVRAEVQAQGLRPWVGFCGRLLSAVGQQQDLAAPITKITWQFEPTPQTTLSAGFAGG